MTAQAVPYNNRKCGVRTQIPRQMPQKHCKVLPLQANWIIMFINRSDNKE